MNIDAFIIRKKKKTKIKSGETWLVTYSGEEVVQRGARIVLGEDKNSTIPRRPRSRQPERP